MSKLLSTNFSRLKKDRIFLIAMLFMFGFGIFAVLQRLVNDPGETPDDLFFIYSIMIGLVSASFCSLYLGTDYSDGTIRNKLIVGHTKKNIYLSNLITCSIAGIFLCFSYIVAVAALGIPFLGMVKMNIGVMFLLFLLSLVMVIACTSFFVLICMLNQNKAIAAVICILSIVALLLLATMINARLEAPPFFDNYVYTDNRGVMSSGEVPNPQYLTGVKREMYQFFLDFLPTGQAIQIVSMSVSKVWRMLSSSIFITVCTTVSGIIIFRKKDIK